MDQVHAYFERRGCLRMKGETPVEVASAAAVMRRHATLIDAGGRSVVDTCGTGFGGFEIWRLRSQ